MITLVIFVIAIVLLVYIIRNKILIRIDTFFRKGFSKHDDKYGVYCFTGKQGDGKTYSLVDMLSNTGKNKIKICNIKSLCVNHAFVMGIDQYKKHMEKMKTDDFYIYETDFNKIQEFLETCEKPQKYIIIYDEIFSLIEKGKLSKESLSFLSQMRKRGLYLYTTAQEWLEINVTFRRYVRYQVTCSMFNVKFFDFAISINEINNAYEMKWDNEQNEYVCPRILTTIKKCSKKIADSYDTYEVIETQGRLVTR